MNVPNVNGVPGSRKCMVCGKECDRGDRNTDGTFAHRECLYKQMTRIVRVP